MSTRQHVLQPQKQRIIHVSLQNIILNQRSMSQSLTVDSDEMHESGEVTETRSWGRKWG